ncbi:MAG: ElyC/SanA/YdcF family protein [Methylocella sp.]
MFFPVSKIFWFIVEPVSFLLILGILGVFLGFTRFTRVGRALAVGAMLALALGLYTPMAVALLRPLENRFPQPPADLPAPAGVIVLGGGLDPLRSEARGQSILSEDGVRLTAALELARRYPTARLIFTGGSGNFPEDAASEATGVRKFWLSLGVPEDRMSFEGKSRNTWENALFTRDLLAPKPGEKWLLVTSAWHMPRSMGIFRRLGFDVIPYPVAYRSYGDARDWTTLAPFPERVFELDFSIREWIGLLAYRLTGKTDALFPAP